MFHIEWTLNISYRLLLDQCLAKFKQGFAVGAIHHRSNCSSLHHIISPKVVPCYKDSAFSDSISRAITSCSAFIATSTRQRPSAITKDRSKYSQRDKGLPRNMQYQHKGRDFGQKAALLKIQLKRGTPFLIQAWYLLNAARKFDRSNPEMSRPAASCSIIDRMSS